MATERQLQLLFHMLDYLDPANEVSIHNPFSIEEKLKPKNIHILISELIDILNHNLNLTFTENEVINTLHNHNFKINNNRSVYVCSSSSLLMLSRNPHTPEAKHINKAINRLKNLYRDPDVDLATIVTAVSLGRKWAAEVFTAIEERREDRKRKDRVKAAKWRSRQDPEKLKAMQRKWEKAWRERIRERDPDLLKIYNNGESVREFRAERAAQFIKEIKE